MTSTYSEQLEKEVWANRGKKAEAQVKALLEYRKKHEADFDYERLPDARAGRGVPAQAADFIYFMPKKHGLIEVKEIKKGFRLHYKRLTQLGKMRRRAMAGGEACCIVKFLTTDQWVVLDLEFLLRQEDKASWNLKNVNKWSSLTEAFDNVIT